jgi:hypothetical protein
LILVRGGGAGDGRSAARRDFFRRIGGEIFGRMVSSTRDSLLIVSILRIRRVNHEY